MLRQLDHPSSQPPTIGASAGATPKIIDMSDMARCAVSPEKRSRTTVRPTIIPPPATTPCRARPTSNQVIDGASAQNTEVAVKSASPPTMIGLRPSASDNGPCSRLITAKVNR